MPFLFGRQWSRSALLQRVGRLEQVAGITSYRLTEGPAIGVHVLQVRTGSGLTFTVSPDRGMDILSADFLGCALAWNSSVGVVAPPFFEPGGLGWLRGFAGGLITTCGLTHFGPPGRDEIDTYGLHGRASFLPAEQVAWRTTWDEDDCTLTIEGTLRETRLFGENVTLHRRISTSVGSNTLTVHDTVTNAGWQTTPHMLLYHANFGFPLLDQTARLVAPTRAIYARDTHAADGLDSHAVFDPPCPNYREQVFRHDLSADSEGRTVLALVNDTLLGGLGVALRYSTSALPALFEWKQVGQGAYVVGLEPANCTTLMGRDAARKEGILPELQPGETRVYSVEFAVLHGAADISLVERQVEHLRFHA